MKLVIQTERLKAVLSVTSRIVNKKTGISVLSNVLLDVDDQSARVVASDGNMFIELKSSTVASLPGRCTLPGNILYDLIQTVSDDFVTIESSDDHPVATITWSNGRATIPSSLAQDYPDIPAMADDAVEAFATDAAGFADLLKMIIPAVGQDPFRPVLAAGYFEYGPKGLTAVGTDSKRVHIIPFEGTASAEGGLLLARDALVMLRPVLAKEGEMRVLQDFKKARIMTENITVTVQTVPGKFVAYRSVVPKPSETPVTIDKELVCSVLKRMNLSDKSNATVVLELSENRMAASAQDSSWKTSIKETVACGYAGAPMKVGFKSDILMETLQCLSGDTVELHIASDRHPMLMRTSDGEMQPYAVMIPTLIKN